MSQRVWVNSLWSKGVGSMRIVPPLGIPWSVYSVTIASASCPVGRSVISEVRLLVKRSQEE